jgi:hypothetical protein
MFNAINIKSEISQHGIFKEYFNNSINEQSNYKLHISLPIAHYDTKKEIIHALLHNAITRGVISCYKEINLNSEQMKRNIIKYSRHKNSPEYKSRVRQFNNPFTIYLSQNTDNHKLIALLFEIEKELFDTPEYNKAHCSLADIPLHSSTPHIIFRQEELDGVYITIAKANELELLTLKRLGENSDTYKQLKKIAADTYKPLKSTVADTYKQLKAEKNFKQAYNALFKYKNNTAVKIIMDETKKLKESGDDIGLLTNVLRHTKDRIEHPKNTKIMEKYEITRKQVDNNTSSWKVLGGAMLLLSGLMVFSAITLAIVPEPTPLTKIVSASMGAGSILLTSVGFGLFAVRGKRAQLLDSMNDLNQKVGLKI